MFNKGKKFHDQSWSAKKVMSHKYLKKLVKFYVTTCPVLAGLVTYKHVWNMGKKTSNMLQVKPLDHVLKVHGPSVHDIV